MLPIANFEPVRCTLLSVRSFDFDESSCSFALKKSPNDGDGVQCRVVESYQRRQSRARDKQAWRALQRATSTPRSQVRMEIFFSSTN